VGRKAGTEGLGERRVLEGGSVPRELRPLLSQLGARAQERLKVVKGGLGEGLAGHRSIARVIQHKQEGPVGRTVVIQNSREAHQVFGIRNAPSTHRHPAGRVPGEGPGGVLEHLEEAVRSGARLVAGGRVDGLGEAGPGEAGEGEAGEGEAEGDLLFSDAATGGRESASPVRTVVIKNTPEDFARFGVTNVPEDFLSHLVQQDRPAKAAGGDGGEGSSDSVPGTSNLHGDLSAPASLSPGPVIRDNSLLPSSGESYPAADYNTQAIDYNTQAADYNTPATDYNIQAADYNPPAADSENTLDYSFPQQKQTSGPGRDFSSPNTVYNLLDPDLQLSPDWENTLDYSFPQQSPEQSTAYPSPSSPRVSLPPVPEVVRPSASSTNRPHSFVRKPAITKVQGFAQPGSGPTPAPATNQHILTNRPMTFQTASGQFQPPSTLLFGFKPLTGGTTPISRPTPRAPRAGFSQPPVGFGFQPSQERGRGGAGLDVRLQGGPARKGARATKSRGSSVLERISSFLEPLTEPLRRLIRGL
jgi:hypothetical protein